MFSVFQACEELERNKDLNFHEGVILWILDIELQKVISLYVQQH